MRNVTKYPNNKNVVTVYLGNDVVEILNRLSEETGVSRGRILSDLCSTYLPRAKAVEKVVVTRELHFE